MASFEAIADRARRLELFAPVNRVRHTDLPGERVNPPAAVRLAVLFDAETWNASSGSATRSMAS